MIAAITVVAVIIAFVVGYVVRRSVHKATCKENVPTDAAKSMAQRERDWDKIAKRIDAAKIDANLK